MTPYAATLTVRVNTARMQPGIYEGRVLVAFPGGVNRTVNVLLVLSPGTGGKNSGRLAEAGCTPSSTPMAIVDDCGNPVSAASVGGRFSKRDRSLTLVPVDKQGR